METITTTFIDGTSVAVPYAVLKLSWDCYAPSEIFNAEHASRLGALILPRCGLTPDQSTVLEGALPAVSQHVAECGVPDVRSEQWAHNHGVFTLVRQGLEKAHVSAQEQAQAYISRIPRNISEGKRLNYAVNDICEHAYQHAPPRESTGEAYYAHPRRVAGASLLIFEQLKHEGRRIDEKIVDAVVFMDLMHDTFEEARPRPGPYDPENPVTKFTPLFVSEVLTQLGNTDGPDIANAIRLASHFPKQVGAPDYRTYIKRILGDLSDGTPEAEHILRRHNAIAIMAKIVDIMHNISDPKPNPQGDPIVAKKISDKHRDYVWSVQAILGKVSSSTEIRAEMPWLPRYCTLATSMQTKEQFEKGLEMLDIHLGLQDMATKNAA